MVVISNHLDQWHRSLSPRNYGQPGCVIWDGHGRFSPRCDGCGEPNTVRHALKCKFGGIILACHNEIRDELSFILQKHTAYCFIISGPVLRIS